MPRAVGAQQPALALGCRGWRAEAVLRTAPGSARDRSQRPRGDHQLRRRPGPPSGRRRGSRLAGGHRTLPQPQRPRPPRHDLVHPTRTGHRCPPRPCRRHPGAAHRPAAVRAAAELGGVRTGAAQHRRHRQGGAARAARHRAARAGRGVPAHRVAAPVRQLLSRRIAMVDSALRGFRRRALQHAGVRLRTRQGGRRASLPGRRAPRPPARGRPRPLDHRGAVHLRRHAAARRSAAARCSPTSCWKPPWPGWPPAR